MGRTAPIEALAMTSQHSPVAAAPADVEIAATEIPPLISTKDLYEVPRLAVQAALAWALPEPAWWPLSRLFGTVNAATHPARTRADVERIEATLKGTPFAGRERYIAAEAWANRYEERFHYLRAWRPGGWNPVIEVTGVEHVAAARAKGRGIVFWSGTFAFNSLVNKMAWHRLGLAVSHFSRPAHGFSSTRFGIHYLNAVRRGIEDRYLRERLMTAENETRAALALIRERLDGNGVVSFMIGDRGRHRESAKFLGARITLATGPLAMAEKTGAALLPVCTLRTAPGQFEVVISAPILAPQGTSGDVDYAAAVQAYADVLAPYVLRDPGQWRGWELIAVRE